MKKQIAFLLLGLLLGLCQCGKEAILDNSAYIGVWNANDGTSTYNLSIDNENNAYWVKSTGSHLESLQGEAKIINNNLHIGFKHFAISQSPASNDSTRQWKMILSGVTYTR